MATVAQLVTILANRLDEPEHVVRQKLRQLQDDGLLPVARGRAVPEVEPRDVVLAIFAVLASDTVKEASRTALLYSGLEPNGHLRETFPQTVFDRVSPIGDTGSAGVFLANMLVQVIEENGGAVENEFFNPRSNKAHFDVVTNWPELFVSIPTDEGEWTCRFHESGQLRGFWRKDVRRSVTFSGITLSHIADDLRDAIR